MTFPRKTRRIRNQKKYLSCFSWAPYRPWRNAKWAILALALTAPTALAADLSIGPNQHFPRLEDALAAAKAGDVILVHPAKEETGYPKTAILVRTPNLTFRALPDQPNHPVKLSGLNFNYTGDGRVPRAVIQFEPSATGCTLDGFDISGAHNDSHNGAAVRINSANNITIKNCDLHDNDMGIMSNGQLSAKTADNQLIESCRIHHNGNAKEPGQNHNLYLGGTSATIRGCDIFASLTGNNLKSRAHLTRIEGCYIHDSAAREIDLVDDKGNTDVANSDALVAGCILVKSDRSDANHNVIHFGQDVKQNRIGTIWIINNTIITPYISPVLQLSAEKTSAVLINNIVWDKASNQKNQVLIGLSNGADLKNVTGSHNWFSPGFTAPTLAPLDPPTTWLAKQNESPPFTNPAKGDYHLAKPFPYPALPPNKIPSWPTTEKTLYQFTSPLGATKRTDDPAPILGALELPR